MNPNVTPGRMQQRPDLPCRGPQQRCGLRAAGRHRRAVALRPGAAVVPEDEDRETLLGSRWAMVSHGHGPVIKKWGTSHRMS